MQSSKISENAILEKSYNREDWQGGYQSLKQEFDYWIDDIEGEIPPELQGTLFRNGPGLLDINGQQIHHPFDGDGMISRISFINGRAHFRNRFIRTEGYLEEQKAGKILYRGVFGTQKPGGWLANIFDFKMKDIANTNVIYWGSKLLALWEAAEPHRLDPNTLETLEREYFNGVLSTGEAFSAHPRLDPSCNQDNGAPCLVNFSIQPGLSTTITIFELNPAGEIIRKQAHSVPGFCFIHDFLITPNYCIFFQNPVTFNPLPFALGIRSAGECIKFQPNQPTRIIVIPRNPETAKAGVKILETQSGFVFHHVNAFEVGDEIVIDSICYDSLSQVEPESDFRQVNFDALAPGQIWRFALQLQNGTVQRQLIESRCCEFPTIHPDNVGRQYRYLYIGAAHAEIGNAPLQAILKIDLDSGERQLWSAAPRGFIGEPIFVPRPNSQTEDDGWLLALVYDAAHQRSDVVILDARDLHKGAIARLHLQHHIPYGLHGSFTPEVFVQG
ncbi:Retinal pigment epithelial membrane protein [Tolypothrix tenuis PCC 7101]|uniref:Retinal pigment epithelial membrane protein n=1 Tax=Tolypothrix tenuis PCC 7101 TaxID=231146 RepID=A0A1Z4MV32_9CYAN|nr:carotenoid oxygenase family protein [Aulosira sp. FACHB-113]BAY97339.1 Retinal pigment epithelial membrane protein [Tolypothrix tenuis PCC 7101]BAZ72152.1 Retinal pigment epithelial membrane protein [Aulosira laxa NIES-50]